MEYFKKEKHELLNIWAVAESLEQTEDVKNLKLDIAKLYFNLKKIDSKEKYLLLKKNEFESINKEIDKLYRALHKIRVRQKKGSELEK